MKNEIASLVQIFRNTYYIRSQDELALGSESKVDVQKLFAMPVVCDSVECILYIIWKVKRASEFIRSLFECFN